MKSKYRLQNLEQQMLGHELQDAVGRDLMMKTIQSKLGLPLPLGVDHAEALVRLKQAIADKEFGLFADWVRGERSRVSALTQGPRSLEVGNGLV